MLDGRCHIPQGARGFFTLESLPNRAALSKGCPIRQPSRNSASWAGGPRAACSRCRRRCGTRRPHARRHRAGAGPSTPPGSRPSPWRTPEAAAAQAASLLGEPTTADLVLSVCPERTARTRISVALFHSTTCSQEILGCVASPSAACCKTRSLRRPLFRRSGPTCCTSGGPARRPL